MRRRPLLAALGASSVGSIAGCLGSLGDTETATGCHEPLPGRFQWRYDACNSGHAAGISAPTEEPELQRVYRGAGAPPLIAGEALFNETWSADIGGDTRWQVGEPGSAGRNAALYEDSVIGIASPFDGIWAISTEDGSERWQVEPSPGPAGPLWPVGPLTIQADRAYYGTMTGVGCVDLAAQEEAWVADLDAEFPYLLRGLEWKPPAVTSSHVFALTANWGDDRDWEEHPRQLYALDPDTGEIDWTVEFEPGEEWITAGPIVGDGLVFARANVETPDAEHDGATRIIAVDPAAREVAWRQTFAVQNGIAIPATANGRFYVSHGDGVEAPNQLAALDTADGSVVWQAELDTQSMVPTITEEAVVANDGGHLRTFDPETGDARWDIEFVSRVIDQTDIEGSFGWRQPFIPVVHDGRIFVYLGEDRIVEFQ